jgi:hypothetical protein
MNYLTLTNSDGNQVAILTTEIVRVVGINAQETTNATIVVRGGASVGGAAVVHENIEVVESFDTVMALLAGIPTELVGNVTNIEN